jgi:hypothetical protein
MPENQNKIGTNANNLPDDRSLNIGALSGLFNSTTNSYKYIFFTSILDLLKRRNFDVSKPISFQDLVVEMLANAWYPHTYFKLSFGTQDRIIHTLESLELAEELKFTDPDKQKLRQSIESKKLDRVIKDLTRYVPFRLIIPFLERHAVIPDRGQGDKVDRVMPQIALNYFETAKPLYCFDSDNYSNCTSIIFHPDWANYLDRHYTIVRGWVAWEWLQYMQRRNPTTPGLSYKLFAPMQRESLSKQTKYWKTILQRTNLNCIYSDRQIELNNFSLDHYIPWSFIAHDRLWNLIPTLPEINSSKSDRLPPSQYFDRFVAIQHLGLTISQQEMSWQTWNKTVEDYTTDLGIYPPTDLIDLDKLSHAYSKTIQPLLAIASNQGFRMWERG